MTDTPRETRVLDAVVSLVDSLLDDFDIVMFDPRGVERSDPVTCGTDTGSAPTDPAPRPTSPSARSPSSCTSAG